MATLPPARRAVLLDWFTGARTHLLPLAVATGVIGGLFGAGYVELLTLLRKGLWPTHWALLTHWLLLAGAGIVIAVLLKLLGDPGDTELLVNNIHVSGGVEDTRSLWALVPISLLGIAVGGGIGPEAPLTQATGTLGSALGRRRRLTASDTRVLTITGMAAGFTVLFAAPFGSAVFALEILHRRGMEYYEALVPSCVGALVGYGIYTLTTGLGLASVWTFPAAPAHLHVLDLLWAVAAGAGGAALAYLFTYASLLWRWLFRPLPMWAKPVVTGVALGAVAYISPYALTYAEFQLGHLSTLSAVAIGTLLLATLGHLVSAPLTMAGRWKGGFIIPLFFMGYCLGRAGGMWLPAANVVVLATAMMVSTNVGVTKTPLGSTLVVAEMAGIRLLPTLLIAALVSLMLTSGVRLIESQRQRDRGGPDQGTMLSGDEEEEDEQAARARRGLGGVGDALGSGWATIRGGGGGAVRTDGGAGPDGPPIRSDAGSRPSDVGRSEADRSGARRSGAGRSGAGRGDETPSGDGHGGAEERAAHTAEPGDEGAAGPGDGWPR